MAWFKISTFTNPTRFMRWSGALVPWLAGVTAALLLVGLYQALFVAPADYQQGEAVRIMYVHVPSAYMASLVYGVIALASAVALIWRDPLADIAAQAAAPLGAAFTFVALASGSLWGEPMWGTWWVWDARLTSVLVLFFLYLGYMALVNAFDDPSRGAGPARSWRWWARWTCRSSNSRWIGGTRCTSRPASSAWMVPPSRRNCCGRCWP